MFAQWCDYFEIPRNGSVVATTLRMCCRALSAGSEPLASDARPNPIRAAPCFPEPRFMPVSVKPIVDLLEDMEPQENRLPASCPASALNSVQAHADLHRAGKPSPEHPGVSEVVG